MGAAQGHGGESGQVGDKGKPAGQRAGMAGSGDVSLFQKVLSL